MADSIRVPRKVLEELVRKYHVRRLAVFGSAARGELRPDSDIDLLIEFEPGKAPSLGRMVTLKEEFSALFGGRKVDLVTPAVLENPYRRRTIERDLELLYAA
ncbi:MAG: nucleotidyltransferase [Gammaproteobacteria bacterium]|nr:MAG: nucleotidyltransferase [Gammaproteobacteria bacterium]